MDKMEILKLAFEKSTDGKEALALAREIEAFIKNENPLPKIIKETIKDIHAIADQPKKVKAHNHRHPWDSAAILHLCQLLNNDRTPSEIAQMMGRSEKSILSAIYRVNQGEYMRGSEGQPR